MSDSATFSWPKKFEIHHAVVVDIDPHISRLYRMLKGVLIAMMLQPPKAFHFHIQREKEGES